MHSYDVIVVGSGLAGQVCALELAQTKRVLLVTKDELGVSNSAWAQGGIAAVSRPEDSFTDHCEDTLRAGAGLCDASIVDSVVRRAPDSIAYLEKFGVSFAKSGGEYELGLEGGHSARRILHSGDITGAVIQRALVAAVHASSIVVRENSVVLDLITEQRARVGRGDGVAGIYVLRPDGGVEAIASSNVVLATGGWGRVYLYTTNPDAATGDGLAIAARAGLPVANLEFVQFHPTCLYHPDARTFLLSEAVRGEGATLRDRDGVAFMGIEHELADLAPRDVVARAIDRRLKVLGTECVYLDCRTMQSKPSERFPTLHAMCKEFGFDMDTEPIPVVPAAHYQCGGIVAELNGRTSMRGLYAIGEVAYTGLHGANRLASNSLLEAVVQARECAAYIDAQPSGPIAQRLPEWESVQVPLGAERAAIAAPWDEIRRTMSHYVGIVRSKDRLQKALRRLRLVGDEVQELYWSRPLDRDIIELRNIQCIAEMIIRSALARTQSIGLHSVVDPANEILRKAESIGPTVMDTSMMRAKIEAH